jgi:hypothetical protein
MSYLRLQLNEDTFICFPEFPDDCNFVSFEDSEGNETEYWDAQEWRDHPEEVMGAIMGTLTAA